MFMTEYMKKDCKKKEVKQPMLFQLYIDILQSSKVCVKNISPPSI